MLVSCGGRDINPGEDYGNILLTPLSEKLTQEEHAIGWGKSECTMCHNLENIHLVNRTGNDGIDITALHNQVLSEGEAGCVVCHGANGVP